RRRRRGAMPVLLARRKPHHVAWPDFLDPPTGALDPADAGGDDQGLTERVRVPRRSRTGLEGDARTGRPGRVRRIEQGIDADRAGEPLRRSLAGLLRAAA